MERNTGTIIAIKQSSKGVQVKIALDLRVRKLEDEWHNIYLVDDEKHFEINEKDYLELDKGIRFLERHTKYVFTIEKAANEPKYKITCLETN